MTRSRTLCTKTEPESAQVIAATSPLASRSTKATNQTSLPCQRLDQPIMRSQYPRPKRARRRGVIDAALTTSAKSP